MKIDPVGVAGLILDGLRDDGHIAAWLPAAPGVQEALVEEAPPIYFRPLYVGPAGSVGVELSEVDDEQLGSLIREAFNLIAAKDRRTKR